MKFPTIMKVSLISCLLVVPGWLYYKNSAPGDTAAIDAGPRRSSDGFSEELVSRTSIDDANLNGTSASTHTNPDLGEILLVKRLLEDPIGSYLSNIQNARAGDADAMLIVARAIDGCADGLRTETPESVFEAFEQGFIPLERYEQHLVERAKCARIREDIMAHDGKISHPVIASNEWKAKSAEAGNKTARLLQLHDLPLQDEEMASLLDELVDQLDPEVLIEASRFEAGRAAEHEKVYRSERWQYLACKQMPSCNDEAYLYQQSNKLYPSELAQIEEFADRFTSIKDEDISFVSIHQEKPHRYSDAFVTRYLEHLEENELKDVVGGSALIGFKNFAADTLPNNDSL